MPTFTSLKLLRTLDQTGDFFQMFNQNSGCFLGDSLLKNLDITIECLTPGILDLAAAGLPNLHTLSLSICYFNTHHLNPRNEEYEVRFTLLPNSYFSPDNFLAVLGSPEIFGLGPPTSRSKFSKNPFL